MQIKILSLILLLLSCSHLINEIIWYKNNFIFINLGIFISTIKLLWFINLDMVTFLFSRLLRLF